jgi:hypothetical protein
MWTLSVLNSPYLTFPVPVGDAAEVVVEARATRSLAVFEALDTYKLLNSFADCSSACVEYWAIVDLLHSPSPFGNANAAPATRMLERIENFILELGKIPREGIEEYENRAVLQNEKRRCTHRSYAVML